MKPTPCTACGVFMVSPSSMKIQVSEEPKSSARATAASSSSGPVRRSKPIRNASDSRMTVETSIRPDSTSIFAVSTEERAIGIVRKRSITPLLKSSLTPEPTDMAMFRPPIASRPGMM